jgi:hypothetical protein
MAPKKFSEQSLDPIANDCFSYPCTDCNTQPAFSLVVGFDNDNEVGGVNLFPSSRKVQKL